MSAYEITLHKKRDFWYCAIVESKLVLKGQHITNIVYDAPYRFRTASAAAAFGEREINSREMEDAACASS